MNCFELRRRKLAAPRELNAEAEAHQRKCASCAAFVERLGAFEESLQSELRVSVPDGLADRVLLHVERQAPSITRGRHSSGGDLRGVPCLAAERRRTTGVAHPPREPTMRSRA